MSFKFEFKIDYEKLTALLDTFLKSHSDELTSIMGQCLKLQQQSEEPNIQSIPPFEHPSQRPPVLQPEPSAPSQIQSLPIVSQEKKQSEPDCTVDNRPLIGDSIPEDPLQNLFSNTNNQTRYHDRNPNNKKGGI